MSGCLITFEGTEGSGKSTQIELLSVALRLQGHAVRVTREPGGTAIGEEIRHTLKHSPGNHAMTPETELLLLNASRAQLVHEIIRPALAAGEIVLCDRFYDSTLAYQVYGRGLHLDRVLEIIEFAIGETRPDLTLWLSIPLAVSEERRALRKGKILGTGTSAPEPLRDRFEEADVTFFTRVEEGYKTLARMESARIHEIDATRPVEEVARSVLELVRKSGRLPDQLQEKRP